MVIPLKDQNNFTKITLKENGEDVTKYICIRCNPFYSQLKVFPKYSWKENSSSTSRNKHLISLHQKYFSSNKNKINTLFHTNSIQPKVSVDKKVSLQQALIKFAVTTDQSFGLFKNVHFIELMQIATDGKYNQYKPEQMVEYVHLMAKEFRTIQSEKLRLIECKKAISLDLWRSPYKNYYFLCLNVHFIDENFILQKVLLDFIYFGEKENHSSENLHHVLVDRLKKSKIFKDIKWVTSDSASNNILLFKMIQKENKEFGSHSCLAHCLDLFSKICGQIFSSELDSLVKILGSIGNNSQIKNLFYSFFNDNTGIKIPPSNCSTRWHYLKLACEYGLLYEKQINSLCSKLKRSSTKKISCHFVQLNWAVIKFCSYIFKFIYDEIDSISNHKQPSINVVLVIYNHIVNIIEKFMTELNISFDGLVNNGELTDSENDLSSSISQTIEQFSITVDYEELLDSISKKNNSSNIKIKIKAFYKSFFKLWKKYYNKTDENDATIIAHLLDPRFKKYYLSKNSKFSNSEINKYYSKLKQIFIQYSEKYSSTSDESKTVHIPSYIPIYSSDSDFNFSNNPYQELESYFHDPYVSPFILNTNESVLNWWSRHRTVFPILDRIVRDYFCIPATSKSCESVYSQARNVITHNRSNLLPQTISDIMFLKLFLIEKNVPSMINLFKEIKFPTSIEEYNETTSTESNFSKVISWFDEVYSNEEIEESITESFMEIENKNRINSFESSDNYHPTISRNSIRSRAKSNKAATKKVVKKKKN